MKPWSPLFLVFLVVLGAPLAAGMKPPPPPPCPADAMGRSLGLDGMFPPGSPKYRVVEGAFYSCESLGLGGTHAAEAASLDITAPPPNKNPDSWSFPSHPSPWTDSAAQAIQKAYLEPGEATLEAVKKYGPSMLRLLETEAPPEKARKPLETRSKMLQLFPGAHLEDIVVRELLGSDNTRSEAARLLVPTLTLPAWPLWVELEKSRSKALRKTLEALLGEKSVGAVLEDLRKLKIQDPAPLLSSLADPKVSPVSKALFLESLALESDTSQTRTARRSARARVEKILAAVKGEGPELDVARHLLELRLDRTGTLKELEGSASRLPWALRAHLAQGLGAVDAMRADAVTPLLLTLQRDRVRGVRLRANTSLCFLHGRGPRISPLPRLGLDNVAVISFETWWASRTASPLALGEATQVTLKEETGPEAPHARLVGHFKGRTLMILDHNDNGRYTDFGVDNLSITRESHRLQFLSRLVEIDDQWWHLTIDEDNLTLALRPYQGPLGELAVNTDYTGLWDMPYAVFSSGRDITVMLYNYSKGFEGRKVPVGEYSLYEAMVWIKRPGKMDSRAHVGPGRSEIFHVHPGKRTVVSYGGEADIVISARWAAPKDDPKAKSLLWLGQVAVYGQSGEEYHGYSSALTTLGDVRTLDVRLLESPDSSSSGRSWDWRMVAIKDKNPIPMVDNHDLKPSMEEYVTHNKASSVTDGFKPMWREWPSREDLWLQVNSVPPFLRGIKKSPRQVMLALLGPQQWEDFKALCSPEGDPKP